MAVSRMGGRRVGRKWQGSTSVQVWPVVRIAGSQHRQRQLTLGTTSRGHLISELWSSLSVWKDVPASPGGCRNALPQKGSSGSEGTGPAHTASTGAHCSHHHTYRSPCPHLGRQELGIKPEAVDIGPADILSSPALPRIRPACMPFWNSGSQRQRLSRERAQEKEDVGSQTQESELHSIPLTEVSKETERGRK